MHRIRVARAARKHPRTRTSVRYDGGRPWTVLLAGDADLVAARFEFSLTNRERRGDLVAVTRLLLGLRALTRVAGDEQGFLNQSGDVVYNVNRRVLAALLVARRGPSVVSASSLEDRIAALVSELVPEGEDAATARFAIA